MERNHGRGSSGGPSRYAGEADRDYGTVVMSGGSSTASAFLKGRSTAIPEETSPSRPNSELWRLGLTDKLTGLSSRHGFIALGEQQWKLARRTGSDLVLVGLDLETQRRTNVDDTADFTPCEGARLSLVAAGRVLIKSFRRSDVLCRWEGSEFRVLALEADALSEPVLKARIEFHARHSTPAGSAPLLFKGRISRISSQLANSFEEVLEIMERDQIGARQPWNGSARRAASAD